MKREIKFRAWNPETKLMVYVDKMNYIRLFDDGSGKIIDPDKDDIVDINPYHNPPMQFTGLLDKNGKEIYEGDIVTRYHQQGDVAWHKERASFIVHDGFNEPLYQDILGVEVIGNIYENPELLK